METQAPFSPRVWKIAAEVVAEHKHRSFTRPTEIYLEDWWLSRPEGDKGLAVSGRQVEFRKCDDAQRKFHSAPATRRYPSREFHSAKIVKRHGCTTLETFDGLIVSLCGFINKSRTQQNNFSSEVYRDFICGFPFNWEEYAASVGEESSEVNLADFTDRFLPAAMDAYNGGQLHDLVLSMSDAERDVFNEKVYADLKEMLNPLLINKIGTQSSETTLTQVNADVSSCESSSKVRKKRRRNAL